MEWSPATSVCGFCKTQGEFHVETAGHFACCTRWDSLWRAVEMTLDAQGLIPPAREWFVLYGPEAADYRADQYDVVVWIWAVMLEVMLRTRKETWKRERSGVTSSRHLVAQFRKALWRAAQAEYAAATFWSVPDGEVAGRWARRQARTREEWRRRWRGLAQVHDRRVLRFDDDSFEHEEAAWLLCMHRRRPDRWTRWS